MAEANIVELYREDPGDDLGLRIVGGKDTPLGNIVIQEIMRDSVAARDATLAPGDHILEVRLKKTYTVCSLESKFSYIHVLFSLSHINECFLLPGAQCSKMFEKLQAM